MPVVCFLSHYSYQSSTSYARGRQETERSADQPISDPRIQDIPQSGRRVVDLPPLPSSPFPPPPRAMMASTEDPPESFVPMHISTGPGPNDEHRRDGGWSCPPGRMRSLLPGMGASAAVMLLVVVLIAAAVASSSRGSPVGGIGVLPWASPPASSSSSSISGRLEYECPASEDVAMSANGSHESYFDEYLPNERHEHDLTLEDFKAGGAYDGWERDYSEMKESLRGWKEEAFVPNLRDGDRVYESATGMGLNLLLTAEILASHGIRNVTVYGNEYLERSTVLANRLWDLAEQAGVAGKGRICRGDSAALDFVPASAFDLVYTGFLDPMTDPLGLIDFGTSKYEDSPCLEQSAQFCSSDDPASQYLAREEQRMQEEWFGRFVEEMIRIARPGGVVAIETVAESYCKIRRHWGGVDRDWWARTAIGDGWDVDPESIRIRSGNSWAGSEWFSAPTSDGIMVSDGRYHVLMRKRA